MISSDRIRARDYAIISLDPKSRWLVVTGLEPGTKPAKLCPGLSIRPITIPVTRMTIDVPSASDPAHYHSYYSDDIRREILKVKLLFLI